MSAFLVKMVVTLGANHTRPGRTRHTRSDGQVERDFPLFIRLQIAQYPGDQGYYLLHICEDGSMADTYHETVDEAVHQAEFEFGVQPSEWRSIPPS